MATPPGHGKVMMRRRHAVWPSAKLATFIGRCALIALASACGSDLAAGGPVLTTQGDDDTDAADGGLYRLEPAGG